MHERSADHRERANTGTLGRLVIDGRRLTADRTGVGRYLEGLLQEWTTLGLPCPETVLVLKDPAGKDRVPALPGLDVRVKGSHLPGLLWERWALGRVLRAGDLLFAPANLVPGCWRGRAVLVVHDVIGHVMPESFPWHVRLRFSWRYRQAIARAKRIIVTSHATRADIERLFGVSPEKIQVVAEGPDPAFRPLAPDAPEICAARAQLRLADAPYFLFVGKRSRRRNIAPLCAAFARHRQTHPAHRLVFVGPANRQARDPRLEAALGMVVAGHVSETLLHGLYAGALGLVYPSLYEGFGLPVVEAMACGCPVITLANSALVETAGAAACYVEQPRTTDLAEAMDRLATDTDYRARLQALGLAQAVRFSRASFARAVSDVLRAAASEAFPPTTAAAHAQARSASTSP